MKQKLEALITNLNQGLVERDQTIKLALLTLLAGENILLVGPPGTGKSLIARRMASGLASKGEPANDYFEYLLTKFSTPEEIFGPLSISELKQDRFKRNTQGYLPTVTTAFLDEIFKSSSSILNALLTILNERIYHNGAETQEVPLRSLIAASNELPTEQAELSALYDRFLVRVFIDYVQDASRKQFFKPAETFQIKPELCITATELEQIASAAAKVEIPELIANAILNIWAEHKEVFKEDRREELSDRRLTKVIQLLRISAVTNGRDKVDLSDVFLLKDCLWNHQDNAKQVMAIISKELQEVTINFAGELIADFNQKTVKTTLKGKGLKNDPFLIASASDFMELSNSELGMQNYFFKQTEDIDISNVKDWKKINFKGCYDGDFHTFLYNGSYDRSLFFSLDESTVSNLLANGVSIAGFGFNSAVESCKTTKYIFSNKDDDLSIIKNCNILNCNAVLSLAKSDILDSSILNNAAGNYISINITNSYVEGCQSTGVLFLDTVKNTCITNCLVKTKNSNSKESLSNLFNSDNEKDELEGFYDIYSDYNNTSFFIDNNISGLVAKNILEKSLVEKCYLSSCIKVKDASDFGLVANNLSFSKVVNNVIGGVGFLNSGDSDRGIFGAIGYINNPYSRSKSERPLNIEERLVFNEMESSSIVETNIINNYFNLDVFARSRIKPNVTLSILEELGWDFNDSWEWKEDENKMLNPEMPILRYLGAGNENPDRLKAKKEKLASNSLADLFKLNIWL